MNRVEKALLANVSTILVKDMLVDKKLITPLKIEESTFSLLNDDCDDDLDFFIYKMQMNNSKKLPRINSTIENEIDNKEDQFQAYLKRKFASSFLQAPTHSKKIKIENREDEVSSNLSDMSKELLEENMHMTKDTYDKLLETISFLSRKTIIALTEDVSTTKTSIIELGLWKVTTDEQAQKISERFSNCYLNATSCNLAIKEFHNILSSNFKLYAKWPTTKPLQQKTFEDFQKLKEFEKFQKCFGLLVSKQISVRLESKNSNVELLFQFACKSDGSITFCQVNPVESYIFNETALGKLIRNENYLPTDDDDYYFIADEGYPLEKTIVKEFKEPSNDMELRFNNSHNQAIEIGKNVFKKLLKRFPVLLNLEGHDVQDIQKIFKTICILNNLYEKFNDTYNLENIECNEKQIEITIVNTMDDEHGILNRMELMMTM